MMGELVYLLPVLGCAAMMGGMMWMMMRGNRNTTAGPPDPTIQAEITALRTEVASLRAAQAKQPLDVPAEESASMGR